MSHEGSVLIVDDEPLMRSLLARYLLLAGLRPEPASNAEEALARLERPGVSLVVIDLSLGHDSGSDLLASIRGSYPDLPAVFCSAYPDMGIEYPDVPFILKAPHDTSQFRREVVSVVKRELRNRCRDVQLTETHSTVQGIHTMLQEFLPRVEKLEARPATIGTLLAQEMKNPVVWGLVSLLLGCFGMVWKALGGKVP